MRVQLIFVLIVVVLQTSPSSLSAGNTGGWIEEDCDGATIHITKMDGSSCGEELILQLETPGMPFSTIYLMAPDWLEVKGKRCFASGKCEDATHARIWLNAHKGRIKKVSGKYTMDFKGQRLTGQFAVKYRGKNPPLECG